MLYRSVFYVKEIMKEINFKYNKFINPLFTHKVNIISVEAEEKLLNGKSLYNYENEFMIVENFSRKFFESNGFQVFNGVDVCFAFNFIINLNSNNVKTLLRNAKLINPEIKIEYINERVKVISNLLNDLINEKIFHIKLIDYAEELADIFYCYNDSKIKRNNSSYNVMRIVSKNDLIKLFNFFIRIQDLKKGVPDLFLINNKEFYFVEVKSKNDTLSRFQNFFIHYFQKMVNQNIFVLHVQTNDWN